MKKICYDCEKKIKKEEEVPIEEIEKGKFITVYLCDNCAEERWLSTQGGTINQTNADYLRNYVLSIKMANL